MKHIYIVRHAKSSWDDWRVKDHDRILNDRGRKDAPIMARALKERVVEISYALCSTAHRAQETMSHFQSVFNFAEVDSMSQLYHSSSDTIINEICAIKDKYSMAILFAHNPGLTDLYNVFSKDFLDNLPTCGIFELRIGADSWSEIDTTNTATGFLITPKQL